MRSLLLTACICAFGANAAFGQSLADYDYANLAFRGVGIDYGYIWPNKVAATPMYSARLDLGYAGPGVRIAPSFSYWSSTMKTAELGRLAQRLNTLRPLQNGGVVVTAADLGPIKLSDLSLSLDAHYVWTTPLKLMTYVGLGLGVHALNGQGESIQDTFVEDLLDSFSAGGAAMAGLEYEVVPRFRMYGEARYTYLSDVHYPALRLGGALMFAHVNTADAPVPARAVAPPRKQESR